MGKISNEVMSPTLLRQTRLAGDALTGLKIGRLSVPVRRPWMTVGCTTVNGAACGRARDRPVAITVTRNSQSGRMAPWLLKCTPCGGEIRLHAV